MRLGGDRSIRVDVRLVTATNADLEAAVAGGLFRQDLYYRLKVFTIQVPPLRERRADIPLLVDTFLDDLSRANAVPRKTLLPETLAALENYAWPGNVRELKNLIESVLVSSPGDAIGLNDLPSAIARRPVEDRGDGAAPGTTLATMERLLIARTLEHTGGNRTHAAELLGIGVRTLQRKIHVFGLDIRPRKRRPRRRLPALNRR
jgi:DNA-binding NtrC family response regulator